MQISVSSPIAHRVIGEVNIAPADEKLEILLVTRLFFMSRDPMSNKPRFSVWNCLGYDNFDEQDKLAFEDHAEHFESRAEAVNAFNADDFNADEWEKCECGQDHERGH